MSKAEKEVFSCFEQAFEADLKASTLTRKQFAANMWKTRHPDYAYSLLAEKLSPNRRPDLSINEVINGSKEMGQSENIIRYICDVLGYNMPTPKTGTDISISEEEIEKIDGIVSIKHQELVDLFTQKKELQKKINRVSQCKSDSQMTETN